MKNERIVDLLNRTATAADIIKMLQKLPPTTPVFTSSDYGDRGHTEQLARTDDGYELLTVGNLYESAYSGSGVALDSEELRDEGDTIQDFPADMLICVLGRCTR